MNKISIILPAYNSEKYLKSCIESISNQTFDNLEIIIINDCSTDNSLKIMQKYAKKDKRIKIINNEQNLGYGKSINIGIKIAKGKYISIVESDDTIEKNMIEKLYRETLEKDYDIIKSNFNYIIKNKKYRSKIFDGIDHKNSSNKFNTPQILAIKPSVWSAIYKKEFLYENNIFFNETQGASFQDTSFQFKCFYFAENFKLINDALYNYRLDNPNSSINSSNKVFEIINEFKTINNFFKPETPKIESYKLLFELRAYLWNYKRIKNKYNNIFLKEITKTFQKYDFTSFFKNKKIPIKEKIKVIIFIKAQYLTPIIFNTYKHIARINGK